MNELLKQFRTLHQQTSPLILGNVWDAHSAQLAEKVGLKALGSSSHAIAFSLGYEDGEEISFDELFFVVNRIVKSVKIPVSVDFESGYSHDPKQVANYVKKLSDIGVVGINLEDGTVVNGKRRLGSDVELVQKIKAIKEEIDLFINARIDTYTTKHENALEESIRRARLYQEAGADGVFVPLMENPEDIKAFVSAIKLPLNLFASPTLPEYDTLGKLGVKRLSHGAKQYEHLMKKAELNFQKFADTKDYHIILGQ